MSVFVAWYDGSQTIIVEQITEGWTWEAVQQGQVTIQQLAQSVSHPVALIVELPSAISVPPKGFAENSKDALQHHVNLGLHTVIYVTRNSATITLWQSVIDMYANPAVQYQFSPSLEAAVTMLSGT